MNKYVTLSSLRREMEFHNRRDCWRLALGGQVIDRPFSLSLIEETVNFDPDSTFSVIHADEPSLTPVGRWRKIAVRKGTMPSKGHTTFFRVPTPPTPPNAVAPEAQAVKADPVETNHRSYDELENRLAAIEEHYVSIIESIQRLQSDIAGMRGYSEMVDDMRTMKQEIEEVRDDINRNQFSFAGTHMEVAGVA